MDLPHWSVKTFLDHSFLDALIPFSFFTFISSKIELTWYLKKNSEEENYDLHNEIVQGYVK